jgi:hypothetical protein
VHYHLYGSIPPAKYRIPIRIVYTLTHLEDSIELFPLQGYKLSWLTCFWGSHP